MNAPAVVPSRPWSRHERIGSHDLYLGNCLEIMPTLGSVDAVITDPPYDERTHTRARSLKSGGADIAIDFSHLENFDHVEAMLNISDGWVVAFCALEQLGQYQAAAGIDRWMRAAVWDRPDGTPQISGDRPGQGAEGIAVMHSRKRKVMWNGGGERGLWRIPRNREATGHPTSKPLRLMVLLIDRFTYHGETIIDPFMGSATTIAACAHRGRRGIGIEKNKEYFEIACRRVEAASGSAGGLFNIDKVHDGGLFD